MRASALVLLGLLTSPLEASAAATQPVPNLRAAAPINTIDSNGRREVVAKLSDALRNNSVFPDVGERPRAK